MNIRSLIKLNKVQLSEAADRAYDNPYEWKLDIWHGPEEMPYHESTSFTKDELSSLIKNINRLIKELKNAENSKI